MTKEQKKEWRRKWMAALGMLADNPMLLRRAAMYVELRGLL
jgi:hypothetical protein